MVPAQLDAMYLSIHMRYINILTFSDSKVTRHSSLEGNPKLFLLHHLLTTSPSSSYPTQTLYYPTLSPLPIMIVFLSHAMTTMIHPKGHAGHT